VAGFYTNLTGGPNSRRAGLGTSLVNSQQGRDIVLKKILANELQGVRVEFVRYFILADTDVPGWMAGFEVPIRLDFDDYKNKGNRYHVERLAARSRLGRVLNLVGFGKKAFSYCARDVVGGCATFHTDFDQRRQMPQEEIRTLCAAVGYQGKRVGLPDWRFLTGPFSASV
jgi:hypothetical protein